jgi:hypothetical protein
MKTTYTYTLEKKHWYSNCENHEADVFKSKVLFEGKTNSHMEVETLDEEVSFSIVDEGSLEWQDADTTITKEAAIELAHYLLRWAT